MSVSPRIAIYPGTFDPFTRGHLDVILRGSRIFEMLILAIGTGGGKAPKLTADMRVDGVLKHCRHLDNVTALPLEGLLVDFARDHGAGVILRGLRNQTDFDYEFGLANMNADMAPDIETVFIMSRPENVHISSRLVREVLAFDGDISPFLPALQENSSCHDGR